MKRKLSFILGLCLILSAFCTAPAAPSAAKKPISWLFSISAKHGTLTKHSDGLYTLTMHLPDVDQVLMFSDRPQRIVKYISAKELKKIGSMGKNNFNNNPPNAVLSAKSFRPIVLRLASATVKGDITTYTFRLIGGVKPPPSQTLTNITLTIDELKTGIPLGGYIG